ncbi:HAD family hydrolase [Microbacter margulisiae]|uniref:Putative hydrolase of the HAD superfamily n=1 Tax=Microbacter margulisiae TaxID=1350067 RepID=A0A7W5DQD3_9PORP|nr:HAD family phosphatase [Microbacter margulisiae]MBB3186654.1 putative hydrolase of the HAD superfamily [Microbacter margulisiae]
MIDFSSIQAIFFDFGGVLIDLDKEQCINNLKHTTGYDFSTMIGNYAQADIFMQLERGVATIDDFHQEIRRISDSKASDQEIDEAWNSFLLDVPVRKKMLLLDLRRCFKVFLLSNTNVIHVEKSLKTQFNANGLTTDDYFDKCYFSNEIHLVKPERALFEYVLHDSGFQSQSCLFLDDGEANIEMAASLGFQTYLVKPNEDLRPLFAPVLEKRKHNSINCRC